MQHVTLLPLAHLLTAEAWSLFADSMDCTEAARQLSETLVHALATCESGAQVEDLLDPVCVRWAEFGASDSEPRRLMRAYINATFAPLGQRVYAIDAAAGLPPYV